MTYTIVVSTEYLRDVAISIEGVTDDPDCEACMLAAEDTPGLNGYMTLLDENMPWLVDARQVVVVDTHV